MPLPFSKVVVHDPFDEDGEAIGGACPPGVCIGVGEFDPAGDSELSCLCLPESKYSRLIFRDAAGPPGEGEREEVRVLPLGMSSTSE